VEEILIEPCTIEESQSLGRLVFLVCSLAYCQTASVVLYEKSNFGGRSKTLTVGDNTLSDFYGLTSSIKVPPGLAVVIYDHFDDAGGYGLSVDLLEDCADLSGIPI
jgi:hypothetical protein